MSTQVKTQPDYLKGVALFIASICLSLSIFMQVLDTTIANVCIPYIAGDLAVSKNNTTWVITMFAAGNSIFLPMTGWLTKRFGNVRVMATSTFLFTIMSWVCGMSISFNMLVIARFFQGAVAGPLIPLSQSLMIMAYPDDKKNLAIAIWTMVALLGPIAGPILGGWIVLNYTWHWIFLINIPFGILATFGILKMLRPFESETERQPLDYIGVLLLAVSVTSLQILLDKGQQLDWWNSHIIVTLTILAVVGFISLYMWEKTDQNPIIDLSLFSDRNFTIGTFLTASSYMILFGAIVISPLWLQTTMGYDAFWAGIATSTMGILPLMTIRFVAMALDTYPPRFILAACFFSATCVYYFFATFTTEVSLGVVAFSRLLFGIPVAIWLPALSMLTFMYIEKRRLPMAMGVFHFVRMMSGGIGVSLIVTTWERRAAVHQDHITSVLTPYNSLSDNALTTLQAAGFTEPQSYEVLYNGVLQQSLMLSTNDVFYASMLLSALFFAISFLFKPRNIASEV